MQTTLTTLSDGLATTTAAAAQLVAAVHGRPRIPSSGLLWKPGVVVTAHHALRRDEDLRVTLPTGETLPATLAGRDHGTDLAVLRYETPNPDAPTPTLNPTPQLGQLVLAIGRTHDTGPTAALGVVSGVSGPWHTWRGGKLDHFIRLDVNLLAGTSGGAAVDAHGQLLGMVTGGLSRTSVLAVSTQTIARVADALLSKGRVARGYLGIGMQPVALPDHLRAKFNLAAKTGLIVLSAEPDAPAGQAGIVIGDVILTLDGKSMSDTADVQTVLGPENVGKSIPATLIRAAETLTLNVTIGERPARKS